MRIVVDPVWMTRNASVFRTTAGDLSRVAARIGGLSVPNMPPEAAARCRNVTASVPSRIRGVANAYGRLGLGLALRARYVEDHGRGGGAFLPFALGWYGPLLRPFGLVGRLAGRADQVLDLLSFLGEVGEKQGWESQVDGSRPYTVWKGERTRLLGWWTSARGFARMNEIAERLGDPWRTASPKGWQPTSYSVGFTDEWTMYRLFERGKGVEDDEGLWRHDYGARGGAFADGFIGVRRKDGKNFAGVEGGVLIGVEAHARGGIHYGFHGVDTAVTGGVHTRHGAMADGSVGVHWSGDGARLGAAGEARLGGEAGGDVGVKVSGVAAKAKGEVSYGLGVEGAADAELGLDKVRLKLNAGATVGIGGTVGFDVSVSPKEVGGDVKDGVVNASKWAGNKLSKLL